jgi:uncharacterized protein YndB with AHSA1/START domain
MLSYESAVVIARPPEAVFPYIVEREKQSLWSDVPMRPLTAGPLDKGSRIEVVFAGGPLKATVGLELTQVEPNRRMAWKSFSGPIDWQGEYVLEPSDDGTRLSQSGTLTFHGFWRLLEPFAGREISSGEVKELEKLKAVVEASAT